MLYDRHSFPFSFYHQTISTMSATAFAYVSVLLLAALLFFPISTIIWVLSVRRLQRKRNTELDSQEINGQRNRARFIALLVSLVFSYLFYTNVIQRVYG